MQIPGRESLAALQDHGMVYLHQTSKRRALESLLFRLRKAPAKTSRKVALRLAC
jgi:hypothetical protein